MTAFREMIDPARQDVMLTPQPQGYLGKVKNVGARVSFLPFYPRKRKGKSMMGVDIKKRERDDTTVRDEDRAPGNLQVRGHGHLVKMHPLCPWQPLPE